MLKLKGKKFYIGDKTYKFIDHLKDGGNASIWKVVCDEKYYAVKILNESCREKKERFLNEINFCKNNNHDNIIKIYDNTEIKDKLCYVMPLYENNLTYSIEKGLSFEEAFDYIFQICEGLKFLHEKNIIHRDLKPENILIENNKLVLADFGIAHFEDSGLTRENDLLANRGYAAPEQRVKGMSRDITIAADIFSLGEIINEIFTKTKPDGLNFILISDLYPWLINVDQLVERCMRYNPIERTTVSEVLLELKLIYGQVKKELSLIKDSLENDFYFEEKNNDDLYLESELDYEKKEDILMQASQDILTAKYLFENKTSQELTAYNFNYHCNIHYMVDELFRSMYLEHLVYNLCKRKFDYESNGYENGKKYKPLDLYHNNDDIRIYEEFKDFLNRNLIQNGKILKMFSSCCDYHCNEIIRNLEKIKRTVDNLKDSPILDIVMKLKVIQDEMVKHEILIEDGISVNWEQSLYYYRDIDEVWMGLKDETSNEEEEEILKEFSSRYNSVITKNNQGYIIRFENRKLYNEFKDYSLNLSKPYYVFEGDVLDIIRIEREFEGIIELKPWNSFDVTNVLAKILGFRNDY